MASTYSDLLRLELIASGEQGGLWGTTTNLNLGTLVEQAIAGVSVVTLSSTTDYDLSAYNGALDESRAATIVISGTPGGATNIIVPDSQKWWFFRNATASTITIKTSAQSGGVSIVSGGAVPCFCDGTNVYSAMTKLGLDQGGTGGATAAEARASLNVPSRTGGDASGTWPIDISGEAATAAYAELAGLVTNGLYTSDRSLGLAAAYDMPAYFGTGSIAIGMYDNGPAGTYGNTTDVQAAAHFGMEVGHYGFLSSECQPSSFNGSGAEYTGMINNFAIGTNAYYGTASWRIKHSNRTPQRITFGAGAFNFQTGSSGPAGSAFSWSTKATISLSGAYSASSDLRLKEDLTPITGALEKVRQITGYTYRRNDWDGSVREAGVVAQEVAKVLPEVVNTGEDGYLQVQYGNLVALLIEAVKELEAEVRYLKGR